MSVEVDRYLMHQDGREDSKPRVTVQPGGKEDIVFFGPAINVVVDCEPHGDKAFVSIEPTRRTTDLRTLAAWIFDEDSPLGIQIDLFIPFVMHDYQKLCVVQGRGRKPAKVLEARMSSYNGDSVWKIPQMLRPLVLA